MDAGTRAVIFDKMRGIQDIVVGEGTHFKIPFFQVGFIPVFFTSMELFNNSEFAGSYHHGC